MTSIKGRLVLPNKIINSTLIIQDGKIQKIQANDAADNDYGDKYILPGLIEVHGHLREPGMEYKEDISHGTKAAVAGGYTTVFDMPNTKPPTTTVELVEDKIKRYAKNSHTDFAINMGVAADQIDQLEKIDPNKINGVKIFTAGHATTPTTIPLLGDLARIFEILGKRGIIGMIHAENQQLVDYFTKKLRDGEKRTDPASWSDARNLAVVLTAALESIALAKQFGVKLYLLHLSTYDEFAAVEFGRKIGVDVYGETVTYQLAFSTDDYKKFGNFINVAPALRAPEEQKKLWQLLREGKIDAVVSEHTPHSLEEKQEKDVWKATSGMPDLQESLAALITHWMKHFGPDTLEEGLIRLSQVTSGNIAKIFGYSQKGSIEIGKDADLVVIDTENKWEVNKKDLFTKAGWSTYEGMELLGRPVATYLRGNLVYKDGKIIGKPQGKLLQRS